ncbi:MAG: hypothetical protein KDK91_04315 [Gammaproteobacteria bacterium]|nr:hypothetical protein [Gammaproteobacteria bacterium]
MGYEDRDFRGVEIEVPQTPVYLSVFAFAVRLLGVCILLVGLLVGYKVVTEAWALYRDPTRIEAFAEAIEQGAHIDRLLSSALPEQRSGAGASATTQPMKVPASYFLAWLIAPLLLFVVGALAMSAISTGGRLALHDLIGDRVARTIRTELRRAR